MPRPSAAARARRSRAERASIAPKFFYDRLGSHLFEAITELPEYYPTRTEAAIFAAPRRRDGRGRRLRHGADRSRRRQLRQGGQPVPPPRADALCRRRYLGGVPARCLARACSASIRSSTMAGLGQDFSLALDLPADAARRRAAGLLLSGLEHRQFHAGRSARLSAPRARARRRRRPADRRRPGQAAQPCSRPPTTTRSASPRPSTSTRCATSTARSAATSSRASGGTSRSSTSQQSRIEMHLEAQRGARGHVAGRPPPLRRRRAHPHRELVQVHARRLRRAARGAGFAAPRRWTDDERAVRRVLGRRPLTSPRRRRAQCSARNLTTAVPRRAPRGGVAADVHALPGIDAVRHVLADAASALAESKPCQAPG